MTMPTRCEGTLTQILEGEDDDQRLKSNLEKNPRLVARVVDKGFKYCCRLQLTYDVVYHFDFSRKGLGRQGESTFGTLVH